MSYTKATDFLAKDSLLPGNPLKIVKGAEIDTEFEAIETADADNMKKSAMGTGVETFLGTPSSANLAAAVTGETGTGALVFATSPTLVTPALGTPASGTLTNCTGLPAGSITGLGAGIGDFLITPSSANLASAVTDETGSGKLVFDTSPTLVTPVLGVAAATSINKLAITAPATGSTLAIAEGKTLTVSNTITLTGTDSLSYDMDSLSGMISLQTMVAATSSSSIDFSGLPITMKRVTVMLDGISTNGSSLLIIQLGDSGGVSATGYAGSAGNINSGTSIAFSTGFTIAASHSAGNSYVAVMVLDLMDGSPERIIMHGTCGLTNTGATTVFAGSKQLTNSLQQIRLTTVGGSDTFDAGTMNISIEY